MPIEITHRRLLLFDFLLFWFIWIQIGRLMKPIGWITSKQRSDLVKDWMDIAKRLAKLVEDKNKHIKLLESVVTKLHTALSSKK